MWKGLLSSPGGACVRARASAAEAAAMAAIRFVLFFFSLYPSS